MNDSIKITKDLKFDFEDLMLPVDFDTEFTLRDLLRASVNSELPVALLGVVLHCPYIAEYWEEAESKPFEPDAEEKDIDYLEIYWWGTKSTYEGKREDGHTWSLHGLGKEGEIPDDLREYSTEEQVAKMEADGYRQAYAVSFTPLYKLADYPLRLKPVLSITDYDTPIGEDSEITIDMIPSITLIELLYGVFWELSFLGSPQERDEKGDDLKQRVKDIDEGNVEMIPWEEVKEQLREKFNKEE